MLLLMDMDLLRTLPLDHSEMLLINTVSMKPIFSADIVLMLKRWFAHSRLAIKLLLNEGQLRELPCMTDCLDTCG
jgi:hypothetical protein